MKAVGLTYEPQRIALALGLASALFAVAPPPVQVTIAAMAGIAVLASWTLRKPERWLFLLTTSVLILPPLPASFGDSGPHPALLAAALGLIAGAMRLSAWRFGTEPVVAPAAALTLVLLASVSMACIWSGGAVAAGSALRVGLFAISPYLLAYIVSGPGRVLLSSAGLPIRLLLLAGTAAAVFACLDFRFQLPAPAGFGKQFIWMETGVFRRAQGLFYDAGALGNMCAFFLVLVATATLFRSRWRVLPRSLLAAAAVVLATALILSYSRAAILNVLAALAALLLLHRRTVPWLRTALVAAGLVLFISAALYTVAPNFGLAWWQRLSQSFTYGFTATDHVLSGRISSWQLLASFIVDHPFRTVLGVGYKTLPYSDVLGTSVIPDNTYLSAFIETGVLGLAALLILHVSILRATWRAAASTDHTAAFYGSWAFAAWVGEMVQMMAADLLTYWRILPLFFFVIAMAVVKTPGTRA